MSNIADELAAAARAYMAERDEAWDEVDRLAGVANRLTQERNEARDALQRVQTAVHLYLNGLDAPRHEPLGPSVAADLRRILESETTS